MKWGKELFTDVEVNTDEEPLVFKAQLFALTGVEPHRQKVMIKGQVRGGRGAQKTVVETYSHNVLHRR